MVNVDVVRYLSTITYLLCSFVYMCVCGKGGSRIVDNVSLISTFTVPK